MKIVRYNSVAVFMEDTKELLNKREIENNLIIGICNHIISDGGQLADDAVLINVFEDDKILASSLNTIGKAIVVSFEDNEAAIREIANFYIAYAIPLSGAIGEREVTKILARYLGCNIKEASPQFIYTLSKVKELQDAEGTFEAAEMKDIEQINALVEGFYEEARIARRKDISELVQEKKIFIWKNNNTIVSIAAIVRETEHAGIVGLVYTPVAFRKKGYASSCVRHLSQIILRSGKTYCGLFTDANNPTSNKIYQDMGYEKCADFQDIVFG